jgi:hypothetical protein
MKWDPSNPCTAFKILHFIFYQISGYNTHETDKKVGGYQHNNSGASVPLMLLDF